MALDAFSVVLGFLAVVEVVLGLAAAFLGWREFRSPGTAASEGRRPLQVLVVAALLAAALLSFPLHYLLLASWVPRWPGIMCVEGVRRIGTGTIGASRFLPGIIATLDVTRILVIFTTGAWLLLRRVPGNPGVRRAAAVALLLGLLAAIDGAAAFTCVVLPKEEILPVAGCCPVASEAPRRDTGLTPGGPTGGSGALSAAHVAGTALLGGGAWLLRRRRRAPLPAVLAILAAVSLPVAFRFLADVAAPAVLRLPHHHCAWCAFARAPETIVWAALHLGAALCAGWAPFAGREGERFLGAASFGFLASAATAAVLLVAS